MRDCTKLEKISIKFVMTVIAFAFSPQAAANQAKWKQNYA